MNHLHITRKKEFGEIFTSEHHIQGLSQSSNFNESKSVMEYEPDYMIMKSLVKGEGVEDSAEIKAKNATSKLFPCHTCGFNAISLIQLITHQTSKLECVKYKCKYCVYTTN